MLFQALVELLAEKGFEAISVQDIAERSTVNRATFYDHFPDKFALLEEMIGERFRTLLAARLAGADSTCQMALKQLVMAVCDFLADVSSGCQKHQRQFEPLMEARMKTMVRDFLLEGFRREGEPVPDAQLRCTVASWAICGAALEWNRAKSMTPEALAEMVLPFLQPVLRRSGAASAG